MKLEYKNNILKEGRNKTSSQIRKYHNDYEHKSVFIKSNATKCNNNDNFENMARESAIIMDKARIKTNDLQQNNLIENCISDIPTSDLCKSLIKLIIQFIKI